MCWIDLHLFLGFQFILDLSVGNIVMAIKSFIVLSTLLVQLFAYSYVGEYLKLQMEGVGDSLYFCSWYDIPTSMAKDIIYIIMKSQDPVSLKAGKFFIVNMETYMSILKTSMSYLSVLRVMVNAWSGISPIKHNTIINIILSMIQYSFQIFEFKLIWSRMCAVDRLSRLL